MESRDMKPRIVMAAPKNDGIFWRQKQYLSFERCTLASVFEEDGLFAELASGDTDLFLAVIDTSFFIRNRGLHTRLRENCSAPLVVAGKSSDPGVRFTMGFADHYLMLPEDEVVIAEIVDNFDQSAFC